MYGVIHFVVKDMILSQFGQEALDKILTAAGLEESQHFKMFYSYDDSVLEVLLEATSKCLDLSSDTVLELFGDYFIMFTLRHGYDDMLRTLGGDMTSFIQNLDSLHSLLALSYDKMVAPSFRCTTEDDGSLTLHYHSSRSGYYPLVKGLLCAAAREIFNQKIYIETVSIASEQVEKGRDQVHVIFHVTIADQPGKRLLTEAKHQQTVSGTESGNGDQQIDNNLSPVTLSKDQFASAFPYHLIFDKKLRLRQFGRNVAKLSPVLLREGMQISSAFHILYPRVSFSVENICRFINAIFIMAVGPEGGPYDENAFSMKGQMMWMDDTSMMIFIGSPRLMSLKEMKRLNMYMADIPLYDVTREMVLLYQQRNAEIDITKKLDETTAELKRTSRDLALEKQRTERLLYQMLPEKVANQLKNGQEVEAEKFDQVTVLFSDIVNFTEIASACTPLDVVTMLNNLYHRFDLKSNDHGVYKVETIGDAYMVVSGVPDITDRHAQLVANFALDMVNQAAHVLSPDTGQPLQIRVGTHSGPVVAGVVGVKMPRYCLFGDTVNTASRMESHAVPGRIHISTNTFELLECHGFLCRERGEVNIKGKGMMKTYFLIGSQNKITPEPNDEHCSLPLVPRNASVEHSQLGNGCVSLRNGCLKDVSHGKDIRSNKLTVDHTDSGLRASSPSSGSVKNVNKDKHHTGSNKNEAKSSTTRSHSECRNNAIFVTDLAGQEIFTNSNSKDLYDGVRRDALKFNETSKPRDRKTLSHKLIRNMSRVSIADLDSGVSLAEQLTVTQNTGNFHGILWKDTAKVLGLSDKDRYNANIGARRVGEVERFPLNSKTCNLL